MRELLLAGLLTLPLLGSTPWTKTDVVLEATYQFLLVVDWRQTSNFHKMAKSQGNLSYETTEWNPLFGPRPSQATINTWFLVGSIGHFATSSVLSGKARTGWQSATVVVQAYAVGHNYSLGVRICW
jgi:hypothetical protein